MRYNQLAAIQHVMADEPIEERGNTSAILGCELIYFCNRPFESMLHLNRLAAEPAHELDVMIPCNTECSSSSDHAPHDPDRIQYVRTAIDEIAEKDGPAPGRV